VALRRPLNGTGLIARSPVEADQRFPREFRVLHCSKALDEEITQTYMAARGLALSE